MMDHNGSPVTTLLNRHPSRDGSPFKTLEKAPSTSTPAPPMSDSTPDNIPVMPVLFSIFAYICLGGLRDFYDSNCDLSKSKSEFILFFKEFQVSDQQFLHFRCHYILKLGEMDLSRRFLLLFHHSNHNRLR